MIGAGKSADRVCFDYETEAQAFDLYFFGGANLREAVSLSADLLGHAPMPPRWALGYLQSTRHFDGPDEVRVLATTLRDKGLPCDALILLSTYSDGKGWNRAVGSLDYESSMFPEPRATIAALKARGFRVVTHEYPVVHESSPLYAVAVEQGFLLDDGHQRVTPGRRPSTNYHEGQRFIDFEEPAAGRWWWDAHRGLNADGVDGWWLDGGEGPTAPDVLGRNGGAALHNRFDLFRQQAFANGEARDNPDRRPFLLCRSGGAGMQRFGAACWSGDINNTWTALEAQASLGLNTGLSGVPLWGTDIGGFYPVAPQSGELFARWFQFGAFNPVFRCHGQRWRMHVPWAYGPEIEAICRRYLDLRYRLMPYTYTLAREPARRPACRSCVCWPWSIPTTPKRSTGGASSYGAMTCSSRRSPAGERGIGPSICHVALSRLLDGCALRGAGPRSSVEAPIKSSAAFRPLRSDPPPWAAGAGASFLVCAQRDHAAHLSRRIDALLTLR